MSGGETARPPSAAWPALAVGFLLAVGITTALHWPLALDLSSSYADSAFHGTHVWAADHIARMITGDAPWSFRVDSVGYPQPRDARFILWANAVLAIPLRPLLGPLGAINVMVLLSPGLSLLAAWAFIRRITGASAWVVTAAALTYALCPFALGSLATGELPKVQLWTAPLYLLCLHLALTGPRRWLWLSLTGLSLALVALTCPTLAIFLPFAAILLVLYQIAAARGRRGRILLWAGVAGVISAASLVPTAHYYGAPMEEGLLPVFMPATPPPTQRLHLPSPVAQPHLTFLGTGYFDHHDAGQRSKVIHMTYLGLPLLLLALALSLRRWEGRGLALSLLVVGVVLAAGPLLAAGDAYLLRDGHRLRLPAWWLDAAGYPTARSGMYYRAIHLASLGLALALAGGLSRLRPRSAVVLAWVAVAVAGLDSRRVVGRLFPLPIRSVAGLPALRAMAASPRPGAVLELPIEVMDYQSHELLLAQVFHRHPTTALPQDRNPHDDVSVAALLRALHRPLHGEDPGQSHAALAKLGFSWVIWRRQLQRGTPHDAELRRALGPPHEEGGLSWWQVGEIASGIDGDDDPSASDP